MSSKSILLAICLFVLGFHMKAAISCTEMDQELSELIKDKQYDKAEKWALNKRAEMPDDVKAHLNLAYVYFNRALKDTVSVNTRAMGLGDGEGGTVQLKKEDVDKYFSSVIQHDPTYGEKTEVAFKDIIQKWSDDKTAYFCLLI